MRDLLANDTVVGATIITHGFQAGNNDGDSLLPLAQAVEARAGSGWLLDYDVSGEGGLGAFDDNQSTLPAPNAAAESGELVLLFDWAAESNETSAGWGDAAGDALFSLLVGLNLVDPASATSVPLHFIAHSFGSAVTSEAVEQIVAAGVAVDHVTFLDPHDFDESGIPVDGDQDLFTLGVPQIGTDPTRSYGASAWDGVAFVDVYYQTTNNLFVPDGRPIPGAFNDFVGDHPDLDVFNSHSAVWNPFYLDSVNGTGEAAPYSRSRISGGQANRPEPTFFDDGQDHTWTSSTIVSGGNPNLAGLASLGFDGPSAADDFTHHRATPQEDNLTLVNGDFAHSGDFGGLFASNLIPGWSHHGGGGNGEIQEIGGANGFVLVLEQGATRRTHNAFYLRPEVASLSFSLQRVDTNAGDAVAPDDVLSVFLTNAVTGQQTLLTAPIAFPVTTDPALIPIEMEIPQNLTGSTYTLTFQLNDGGDGSVTAAAVIDDVRLNTSEFVVLNTADNGPGSFRQTLLNANAAAGVQTITFGISGVGPQTITPSSSLPAVLDPVVIDATSQPGFSGLPLIEINGSSAGTLANGLHISAGNSTVRGLAVNNFGGAGIRLSGPGGNTVAGNLIGTDVTGTVDLGNTVGIHVSGSDGNTIGGDTDADRNIISGSSTDGIQLFAAANDNVIQGNRIGTDVTGSAKIANRRGIYIPNGRNNQINDNQISGNDLAGVFLLSIGNTTTIEDNFIGTNADGSGSVGNRTGVDLRTGDNVVRNNVISGNTLDGVYIHSSRAIANLVVENFVGVDPAGVTKVANRRHGVVVRGGAKNTQIGRPGEGNLISGNGATSNTGSGVMLLGPFTTGNMVRSNRIGTDEAGNADVANRRDGIHIAAGTNGNTIGGPAPADANIISGNGEDGIRLVSAPTGNTIEGNRIGTNNNGTAAVPNGVRGVYLISGSGNTIKDNQISGNTNIGVFALNAHASIITGNIIGLNDTGTAALPNRTGIDLRTRDNVIDGNTVSGNTLDGITLRGPNATDNMVTNNRVGTNPAGTAALPNRHGILVAAAPGNTIGGNGAGNLISGNQRNGVAIGTGSDGTVVRGNLIGVAADGTTALPNGLDGVFSESSGVTIGGAAPGDANTIAFNRSDGIEIRSGGRNRIEGNSLFDNLLLGINLQAGGNVDQPAPVITSAVLNGGIDVTFSVPGSGPLTVEFFIADAAGEEGRTLLDRIAWAGGTVAVTISNAAGATLADQLVATATDADGNTSEFSMPQAITN